MAYEIRERDTGGILDESIYFFRDHWRFMVPVALCILLPANAALQYAIDAYLIEPPVEDIARTDEETVAAFFAWILGNMRVFAWAGLGSMAATSLTAGVLLHGIGRRYLGYSVGIPSSVKGGLKLFPRLFVAAVIQGLIVGVGALTCILGVAAYVALYLFPVVIALENARVFRSFGRSARLVVGSLGRSVALLLLLFVIRLGLEAGAALLGDGLAATMAYHAFDALFTAFEFVAATMLYFSARCRLENLDLDLLANAVDAPPPAPEPAL